MAASAEQRRPDDDRASWRRRSRSARRDLGRTWPNPAVGALLVVERTARVVGRGWTAAGRPAACRTRGARRGRRAARGATLYVTLEPCAHHGKHAALRRRARSRAGIARVVVARSTIPIRASPARATPLARAPAIEVDDRRRRGRRARAHRGHISRVTRRPAARDAEARGQSADGKVGARRAGAPPAITGEAAARARPSDARRCGRDHGRHRHGAADDPLLTVPPARLEERSPIRIVLDAELRTPLARQARRDRARDADLGRPRRTRRRMSGTRLARPGVEVLRVDARAGGRLDLDAVLDRARRRAGITRLLVEGGPTLARRAARGRSRRRGASSSARRSSLGRRAPSPALDGLPLAAVDGMRRASARLERRQVGADHDRRSTSGAEMFTGIVTDVGEVVAQSSAQASIARFAIACGLRSRLDRARRLDRLRRRLPDGGRGGAATRTAPVRGRCRGRDAGAHHGRRLAARARAQPRALAQDRRRARRPYRHRPCRRRRPRSSSARGGAGARRASPSTRPPSSRASSPPRARSPRRHVAHRERRSRATCFSVLIIPHTLAVTTWGERRAGDRVNLEVDLMARYAARLAEARRLVLTSGRQSRRGLRPWPNRSDAWPRSSRRGPASSSSRRASTTTSPTSCSRGAIAALDGGRRDATTSSPCRARWRSRPRSPSRSMPRTRRPSPTTACVALGCVIRGETGHYDIVAGESARALMDLSVARGLPLGNGILTVENEAQAWARAARRRDEQGRRRGARRRSRMLRSSASRAEG